MAESYFFPTCFSAIILVILIVGYPVIAFLAFKNFQKIVEQTLDVLEKLKDKL